MMTGPGTNTYLVGIDEIVGDRPRPRRRRPPRRHRRLRRRPHPLDRLHPHPPRPLARRRRPEGAHRRRGPRLRRAATASRSTAPLGDGDAIEATEFRLRGRAHAGPRLEPPLLPARAGAPAVLRRPHHAGLDRGHRAARRRHGRLPRVARAAAGAAAAAAGRSRPATATSSTTRRPRSTSTSPTGSSARRRCSTALQARARHDRRDRRPVYADVAEELHPVARRRVWAHLRKLADEGKVKGEDARRHAGAPR